MADVIRINTENLQVEYLDTPRAKINTLSAQVEYLDTPRGRVHALIAQVEYATASTAAEETVGGLFFCHG